MKLGFAAAVQQGPSTQLVQWGQATFQEPAVWDPLVPSRLPIVRTGLYLVTWAFQRSAPSASSAIAVHVWRNDAELISTFSGGQANSSTQGASGAALVRLVAGDFLVMRAQAVTGTGGTATVGTVTHLSAVRVGPERWV